MSRTALRRFRFGAAVSAVLLALPGCAGGGGAGDDQIRIGLLVPTSGTYTVVGKDVEAGFKLYLERHDGRLGGLKVDLRVADEGEGPERALPATRNLIRRDRVAAVAGAISGGTVAAVAPELTAAKIPLLGAVGRPQLKDISYTWTTSWLSPEAGQAIAPYLRSAVDGPVYAIGPDYQGGWDQINGFADAFTAVGGKLANPGGKPTFTPFPTTNNFLPYFADIARSGAKAVYTFYSGTNAVDFVRQYAQSPARGIPLYASGSLTEGPLLTEQGDASRGIHNVMNYAPDLAHAANREFVSAWTSRHNTLPTVYAMTAWDAALILDQAVAAARGSGRVTPEAINAAIGALGQIDSPRGPLQLAARTHAPVQTWYLRRVSPDGPVLANQLVQNLATLGG